MCWRQIAKWVRGYIGACASVVLCIGLFVHWIVVTPLVQPVLVTGEVPERPPVVILDAGHGGEDCGAVGINGVYEKDINLAMTRFLAARLRACGIEVVETRTDDHLLYDPATVEPGHKKSADLANRAAVATRYTDAVFISIHMNSFPTEKYDGLQVWYGNGDEMSYALATAVQAGVQKTLQPQNHRKVRASNGNMYLLDHIECPSILIECGFLTNRAECEKLSSEAYQKELSFVLFCVMMDYLNMEEQV